MKFFFFLLFLFDQKRSLFVNFIGLRRDPRCALLMAISNRPRCNIHLFYSNKFIIIIII